MWALYLRLKFLIEDNSKALDLLTTVTRLLLFCMRQLCVYVVTYEFTGPSSHGSSQLHGRMH